MPSDQKKKRAQAKKEAAAKNRAGSKPEKNRTENGATNGATNGAESKCLHILLYDLGLLCR